MMDRMMGGSGEPEPELPSNYKLTDLELNMYEDLISDMIRVLGGSWKTTSPSSLTMCARR